MYYIQFNTHMPMYVYNVTFHYRSMNYIKYDCEYKTINFQINMGFY
jgi:hypothetical protein